MSTTGNTPGGAGPRAVIIDDTDGLHELLRLVLVCAGCHVVGEAADGRAGIRLVENQHPNAILLDLSMPVMDALQALSEIRRSCPTVTIIVLSGFDEEHLTATVLHTGADTYV